MRLSTYSVLLLLFVFLTACTPGADEAPAENVSVSTTPQSPAATVASPAETSTPESVDNLVVLSQPSENLGESEVAEEHGAEQETEGNEEAEVFTYTLTEAQEAFPRGTEYFSAVRYPNEHGLNGKMPIQDMIVENGRASKVVLTNPDAINLRFEFENGQLRRMIYDYDGTEQVRYWNEISGWAKLTASSEYVDVFLDMGAYQKTKRISVGRYIFDVQFSTSKDVLQVEPLANVSIPSSAEWLTNLHLPTENSPLISDPENGAEIFYAQYSTFLAMISENSKDPSEELIRKIKKALANNETQFEYNGKTIDLTNIKISSDQFINATLKPEIIVGLQPEGRSGWLNNASRTTLAEPIIVTESGQVIMYLASPVGTTWLFGSKVLHSFEISIKRLTDLEPDDRDLFVPIYIALRRVAFGITDEGNINMPINVLFRSIAESGPISPK